MWLKVGMLRASSSFSLSTFTMLRSSTAQEHPENEEQSYAHPATNVTEQESEYALIVADKISPDSQEDLSARCPICLENMDSPTVVLPCHHKYHQECLKAWLFGPHDSKKKCPLCKRFTLQLKPCTETGECLQHIMDEKELIQ